MQTWHNVIVHPSPKRKHIWMWDTESIGFTAGRLAPHQESEAKGFVTCLGVNHVALSGQPLAGLEPGDKCVCR